MVVVIVVTLGCIDNHMDESAIWEKNCTLIHVITFDIPSLSPSGHYYTSSDCTISLTLCNSCEPIAQSRVTGFVQYSITVIRLVHLFHCREDNSLY